MKMIWTLEQIEAMEDEAMEAAVRDMEREPIKNFVPPRDYQAEDGKVRG